jgi:hypothetical protein
MKITRTPALILVFSLGLAGAAFADMTDDVIAVFHDFQGRLRAKHGALEGLAKPGMEVRGVPGSEDLMQTVIILTFDSAGEQEVFKAALEAENIPLVTFPEEKQKLLLFAVDMLTFIMKDAIGL